MAKEIKFDADARSALAAGVNKLADAVKDVYKRQPIPERVFTKPPSAELAPGQEDEKSLGVDYALLDRILIELVERGRAASEASAALNVDPALVARIAATTDAYAFKRALEPPFPQARFYD